MSVRTLASTLALCSAAIAQSTIQFPGTMQRSELPQHPFNSKDPAAIAVGDINGDRVPDIVYAGQGGGGVYLQGKTAPGNPSYIGSGRFFDVTAGQAPWSPPPFGLQSFACELADLDGDGDLDCLLATSNIGLQVFVLINDGAGQFSVGPIVNSAFGFFNSEDLAVGDVDGDGDQDFVLATSVWPSRPNPRLLMFVNDGAGAFTEATMNLPVVDVFSQLEVELFDADGDNDLDMFVARQSTGAAGPSLLLQNNGAGVFTDVTLATIGTNLDSATSVDTGDVNGDGLVDILVGANSVAGCFLLVQNPGFTFTRAAVPVPGGPSSLFLTARLADVDADCDLDIVTCHDSSTQRTQLLLNDGGGAFAPNLAQIVDDTGVLHTTLTVADVDIDGDNDILMGRWASPTPESIDVYYNNLRDFDAPPTASVAAGSFDYDMQFVPGAAPGVALAVILIDATTVSPFAPLGVPINRGPCGLPTGDLFGLTPNAATLAFGVPVVAPGTQFQVQGLNSAMIGLQVFAQCGYVNPLSDEIHLLQVTSTTIVP